MKSQFRKALLLEPFHLPDDFEQSGVEKKEHNKKSNSLDFMTYSCALLYVKEGILPTKFHSVPLGLAQISAILKEEGIKTEHEPFILDAIQRHIPNQELEARISSHEYDEVWMSVGSQDEALECIRYAKVVKSIDQDTPVMLGGIFPTFYPDWFLEHQEIDMLIRGAAEDLVRSYARNKLSARKQPGFCYKHSGQPRISPTPSPMPDQSRLPPMDLEGMHVDDYMADNPFCNVLTSRGCPFGCPFCSHTSFWGKQVQYRNMDNIKQELKIFNDYGCTTGYIVDSAFTLNKKHVEKFVQAYKDEGITIRLAFETRADHFDLEMAMLCKRFNPLLVWFGGESGAKSILERMPGKSATKHLDDMRNATRNATRVGINAGSSWVIGLPGETWETVEETRKFLVKLSELGMDIIDVRNLQLFPGTDYFDKASEWGITIETDMRLWKGNWRTAITHGTEAMTSTEIKQGTSLIQNAVLQSCENKPEFNQVLKVVKAFRFSQKHPTIAKILTGISNIFMKKNGIATT